MKKPAVIILAAGRGTRLKSDLPKALHTLCGKPMLGFLLDRAAQIGAAKTVVVAGYGIDRVRDFVGSRAAVVEQRQLLGSGHAVKQAARALKGFRGPVFVLYCDTPLIRIETLKALIRAYYEGNSTCALLTMRPKDPFGYGRVLRDMDGSVRAIIEEKDASAGEKKIGEVNVGAYVFDGPALFTAVDRVRMNPIKKEYYLTDAIAILAEKSRVVAHLTDRAEDTEGVNTGKELAQMEERAQQSILEGLMESGVRIRDPKTTVIDADVRIGQDTRILPSCVIEEGARIGKRCVIGPFARIRGGSVIGDGCVIGNFVEIVRSRVGKKTQIKHLSYIGDAVIGSGVNIGAGTITANYDGKNKHRTVIADGAQVGSGTILVAPVRVGKKAKTGAGTVVTKTHPVPDRAVAIGVPARILKK